MESGIKQILGTDSYLSTRIETYRRLKHIPGNLFEKGLILIENEIKEYLVGLKFSNGEVEIEIPKILTKL